MTKVKLGCNKSEACFACVKALEELLGIDLDALDAQRMRFLEISCLLALREIEAARG